MKKSIFYKLIYICIVALVISGAVAAYILQNNYEDTKIEELTQILTTAATATNSQDASYISSISGGHRVTIIDPEGNPISDSVVNTPMENHKLRPEVTAALEGKTGISKRLSSTTDKEMIYVAISHNNLIYRVAIESSGVDSSFLKLLPAILVGIALAVFVAILLASGISRSLTAPLLKINDNLKHISDMEYDKVHFSKSEYDEINEITSVIDSLMSEISGYIEDISNQNNKLEFILNNMGQGMLLVDSNFQVMLCNRFASLIFKVDNFTEGSRVSDITTNDKINNRVIECIKSGTSRMFDVEIDNSVYAVAINPVDAPWLNRGAFILITDVTEIRSRQKLRQEFVHGVVHDLRNPIASIGENADMINKGLVRGGDQQREYLNEIVSESTHMKEVIDDLLLLSVLDENEEIENPPTIHAYDICTSVQEKFIPMIKEMELSMQITGNKDTLIRMKPEHFEKVMSELMTNAIKYNEHGGKVLIDMEQIGDRAKISISNTGPGVDPILIPRLFERFYREEQNRNSKIKGAGLGLSIIKHIIAIYDGSISVKFDPTSGNTFTITI